MGTSTGRSPLAELRARLPELMPSDRRRLQRRLDGVRRVTDEARRAAAIAEIAADADRAEERVRGRRASVPPITYPAELPVSQKKDDLLAAIRDHQVVIVAGETGSGKTTQLPKICLELGRGVLGMIGHTQPRRLAARTVADRIAEELGTTTGEAVGYQVRFTDRVGENTLVKLMTDGILLAEIQRDRMLRGYDTLIIDEAHERSLNIDFILGYLKQLLPKRPDLKVVITSATIDPHRFAEHFAVDGRPAPVVEVSGRTYPVEVRYRPIVSGSEGPAGAGARDDADRDVFQAIGEAVDELCAAGPGDILVFCSGEREIRDAAEALAKDRRPGELEILPLYARLSSAEQHRVFQPHSGRRVVLATNVAETSLTVPGIRYVVDPGTARISRYSHRTKVQRLPIEPVSQASANQRKGRCGRVAEGICVRLYSEDDFLSRPEFTDAEILRTNLASVILQMSAAGLGDVAAFPFIDPPDRRNIKDGVQLLEELGALDPAAKDPAKRLTPLGRKLAQLPVDPRLARMVLEADRNGCVREVMVIAAALSIQDPRERPADAQQAAAEKHARFADRESDFSAYLNLWRYLRERRSELSSNQFRRMCRNEYLNYLRVREWQDIYSQLRQVVRTLGVTVPEEPAGGDAGEAPDDAAAAARYAAVHQSLLAGLLSHIGVKDADKNEYLGARGARFGVFPGSGLFKKPPRWVMAAELVETSRLWGRIAARVEPEWAEALGGHLVRRHYSEPHWEKKQAAVMAYERVTLYGVPIVAQRRVNYGRIDPELSRELFIRHALVEGDWQTHHGFFHDNRRLLAEVEELEHRARRRDILVDDDTLFEFYDQRIPADVVSGRHFDAWWKKARRSQPELLSFSASMLVREAVDEVSEADYPDTWTTPDGIRLRLTYAFEPGADADGVTVHIPLPVLNQVGAEGFDWQVPGLREELVTALIRALPKAIRRNFVPVPDHAAAVLGRLKPREGPLREALAAELSRRLGGAPDAVPADAWQLDRVPDHLLMTFRIVDDAGATVAEGKDLEALRTRLKDRMRAEFAAAASGIERSGLTDWTFGTLPRTFEQDHAPGRAAQGRAGHAIRAYPALVDEGASVAIRLFDTEDEQLRAMWQGTRRLLLLTLPSPAKSIQQRLPGPRRLALGHSPYRSTAELFDACVAAAVDKLLADHGGPVWDEPAFAKLRDAVRADLHHTAAEAVERVARVLAAAHEVDRRLRGTVSLALLPSLTDIRNQIAGLVYPGFVTDTGWARLPDVERYLRAIGWRLDKLPENPRRDQMYIAQVEQVRQSYERLLGQRPPAERADEPLRRIRWMIEELRVSYFAQPVGTAYPVSDKRIRKAMAELGG
ncbi:ATP-dependent RNA helicase HrpA [Allonocardiopsis opalescens]|uniref:RNA helicase n=1 Tax=Allonocardiopsis opalescens TaxID=1144618 RepID=A0A2T0Q7J0_9ACTN|nr:ATP-dependent RNA helicase HrpA [Allonocardiopsis opalescens]PRX99786.1 ATP-dependent helicase HrpA [Allonocardiopsis opalescens]